jgi:hypothetical protein
MELIKTLQPTLQGLV